MSKWKGNRYLIIIRIATQFQKRFSRLFSHLIPLLNRNRIHPGFESPIDWITDLIMYILDISGVPDLLTQFRLLAFRSIRPLDYEERSLLKSVFKDSLDVSEIWIDPINRLGTRKFAHAYVLHLTINYYNRINEDILVHEAMHILQYQELGSIYITRSIKAQRSKAGYNYGGGHSLYNAMIMGKSIWDFNFEQQAQIIQDYYLVIKGSKKATPLEATAYQFFMDEVRKIKTTE